MYIRKGGLFASGSPLFSKEGDTDHAHVDL
mgnify:FL=1